MYLNRVNDMKIMDDTCILKIKLNAKILYK